MRMKVRDFGVVCVRASPASQARIFLDSFCDLTPAEARRVAAALVKEADKAEKKGRK